MISFYKAVSQGKGRYLRLLGLTHVQGEGKGF